jgi:hypothetical protein
MAVCACFDRNQRREAAPPATPRHPNHSLPLLPSGPGGICELSSRGNRRSHRRLHLRVRQSATLQTFENWRRERDSNPRNGDRPFTHFPGVLLQPLGHLSATRMPGGIVRPIHGPHPRFARASLSAVQIRSRRICRTRETGISRLHTFQACSFNRSDTSPHCLRTRAFRRGAVRAAENTRRMGRVQAKRA